MEGPEAHSTGAPKESDRGDRLGGCRVIPVGQCCSLPVHHKLTQGGTVAGITT